MKRICAWCREELPSERFEPSVGVVNELCDLESHGICIPCAMKYFGHLPKELDHGKAQTKEEAEGRGAHAD